MKLHPRNRLVQGTPDFSERFIFGDAIPDDSSEPYECVVHTEEPAFICRIVINDETEFAGRESKEFASELLYDKEQAITHYVCNAGFRLFGFSFFTAKRPSVTKLKSICDDAVATYQRLNGVYNHEEDNFQLREIEVVQAKPISTELRAKGIAQLISQAEKAADNNEDPEVMKWLGIYVHAELLAGSPEVFTEAQLALINRPEARDLLLNSARRYISEPNHVKYGSSEVIHYHMWAFPLLISRNYSGMWWYYPKLERLKAVLLKALHLPENANLLVSTTLFTFEMLQDCACFPFVNIAQIMGDGKNFAIYDPDNSRRLFESDNQINNRQQSICWIPFLLDIEFMTQERADILVQNVLNEATPIVQSAIEEEISYVSAELLAPLPWWKALDGAIALFNIRKIDSVLLSLNNQEIEISTLSATAEYQPEMLAYKVIFSTSEQKNIAQALWLLVPNIAPEREKGMHELASYMNKVGVKLSECSNNSIH